MNSADGKAGRVIMATLAFAYFAMLTACDGPGLIERKIAARIEGCNGAVPCKLVLSDLTNFQWDRMYAITFSAPKDGVDRIIGAKAPQYTEFTRKLIFLNGGKVVYMEEAPTDFEKPTRGAVVFDFADPPATECIRRKKQFFWQRKRKTVGSFTMTRSRPGKS
jgi:hypothetical protein